MSQKPVRLLTIGLMLVSFMHTVQAADPDPALVQVLESRSTEDRARDAARRPLGLPPVAIGNDQRDGARVRARVGKEVKRQQLDAPGEAVPNARLAGRDRPGG